MNKRDQEHLEQLKHLLILTRKSLALIDLLPRGYAERALQAIRAGDTQGIDQYFRYQLGRTREPAEVAALYKILARSDSWRVVQGLELTKYLSKSVRLEGRRIRKAWEADGVLTGKQRSRERAAAIAA